MYACDCPHQNVRRVLGLACWKEWNGDWLLLGWNVSAATSVLLPLLMLTISRLVHWDADNADGDDNDNNDNHAIPWWWLRRGSADPADRGTGSLIFVYVYSMGLFGILTLYGNYVLRRGTLYGPLQGEPCFFGVSRACVHLPVGPYSRTLSFY
jgi:hypothetical protein